MRRFLVRILIGLACSWTPAIADSDPALPSPDPSIDQEMERVLEELRGVYRTLYALSGEPERARILETLLAHDLGAMRSFGLDLARRTLLNAREVPESVLTRGEVLLFDEDPAVRRTSAQLLATRGGDVSTRLLARALDEESDEAVATEIMRALSQRPGVMRVSALRRWLDSDGEASESAFAVAEAIVRQRPQRLGEADALMLRSSLGVFAESTATPQRISLAWALGMEAYVRAGLASASQKLRLASARAMVDDASFLDEVIGAAKADPRLFTSAVDGVARHRANARGYRDVQALRAPAEELQRDGERRVLLALDPESLVDVVLERSDLFTREQMLRHAEERAGEDAGAWAVALVELIETRTKLWDCAGALRAESLLTDASRGIYRERLAVPRLRCMVVLGQVEEATVLTRELAGDGSVDGERIASVWLDSIGRLRSVGGDVGPATGAARTLLWETMTRLQRERLELFERERAAADVGSAVEAEDDATLSPL